MLRTFDAVNNAPVANHDVATTAEDTAARTEVLANDTDGDGDALILASATQGANGTVTIKIRPRLWVAQKRQVSQLSTPVVTMSTLTPPSCSGIDSRMVELRTIEMNIIEALGTDTMTLERLAPRAGYEVNGHFKHAVSSLRERGILGNKRPGYFVQRQYQEIIHELSASTPHNLPE